MSDLSAYHLIQARPVIVGKEAGWDFTCPDCEYHARYTPLPGQGQSRLEILDLGDPQVHHSNPPVTCELDGTTPAVPARDLPAEGPALAESGEDLLQSLSPGSREWLAHLLATLD